MTAHDPETDRDFELVAQLFASAASRTAELGDTVELPDPGEIWRRAERERRRELARRAALPALWMGRIAASGGAIAVIVALWRWAGSGSAAAVAAASAAAEAAGSGVALGPALVMTVGLAVLALLSFLPLLADEV